MSTKIPRLEFGRTGHESSRLIFGAAALGAVTQEDADRTLGLAFDAGVNHFDVAASHGEAEVRMNPWLALHRDQVFLATKTQRRDKAGALLELDRSLSRLGTDRVDLWQMHFLVDEGEWAEAMGPGDAPQEPVALRFRFGTLPLELATLPKSRVCRRGQALVAECRRWNIAFQLIKAFRWRDGGFRPIRRNRNALSIRERARLCAPTRPSIKRPPLRRAAFFRSGSNRALAAATHLAKRSFRTVIV